MHNIMTMTLLSFHFISLYLYLHLFSIWFFGLCCCCCCCFWCWCCFFLLSVGWLANVLYLPSAALLGFAIVRLQYMHRSHRISRYSVIIVSFCHFGKVIENKYTNSNINRIFPAIKCYVIRWCVATAVTMFRMFCMYECWSFFCFAFFDEQQNVESEKKKQTHTQTHAIINSSKNNNNCYTERITQWAPVQKASKIVFVAIENDNTEWSIHKASSDWFSICCIMDNFY